MSKLYEQYLKLKNENTSTIYLFKSGLFYIALEDDALKLSEELKLKLTNFGNLTLKCGFPESRLRYYSEKLQELNLKYILVKSEPKKNINDSTMHTISTIKNQNIDDSSENSNNYINAVNKKNNNRINTDLSINQTTELLYEIATLDINNLTLKNSFDELYKFHIKAKKIIEGKV